MNNNTICGADCSKCAMKEDCSGCNATNGCPFGEKCFVAEYIKLGCQIEFADMGICYGVVADATFVIVCSYSHNGSEPELLLYKKR